MPSESSGVSAWIERISDQGCQKLLDVCDDWVRYLRIHWGCDKGVALDRTWDVLDAVLTGSDRNPVYEIDQQLKDRLLEVKEYYLAVAERNHYAEA